MDREQMQELINGMRNIVKPYLAKQLKKINFEGRGNTDKAEFETDFEIVLTLAEKALAIPSAEPKTGHWIVHPKGIYAHLVCDKCLSNAPYDCRTDNCPNCGAKMD